MVLGRILTHTQMLAVSNLEFLKILNIIICIVVEGICESISVNTQTFSILPLPFFESVWWDTLIVCARIPHYGWHPMISHDLSKNCSKQVQSGSKISK